VSVPERERPPTASESTAASQVSTGRRAHAASELLSVLQAAVGGPLPIRITCWDGSVAGDPVAGATLVFRRPRALRRLLWAPSELGLVRAYVSGDLDFEGDIFAVLDLPDVIARIAHHHGVGLSTRERLRALGSARRLGALGPPPRPPAEEMRRRKGALHSTSRDAASVSHHYDVGNDFYRLVLGPSLVYSCAYWTSPPGPSYTLDDAQRDKLDLVCAKLGLRSGMRLLDIGCGWGSLAIHAASHYGVSVVGVTVSQEQATLARRRVQQAGLSDSVTIRLQDYREIDDGPYEAISSVGMSEHVGRSQLTGYAQKLTDLLAPGGRLLNHAIASVRALPPPSKDDKPGFIDSYIFPDGEVLPLSNTLDALEHAGLEVRDVEALREHYALTLRAWVDNLRGNWEAALIEVAASRARTWLLYLAACTLAFDHGNLTIHQVVAVKQGEHGSSGIPRIRRDWVT
jgi:cyclopropane-fatty-acyl-phospholipid synthase